uniref:NADH dehydrogenase subunit 6 n=1 Tax=Mirax sp. QL-2014 TaxID=1491721 RepID=A0A0U1WEH2_9HYME|nr:NADH dehydrogenase subunit 6 [Mirax sp. QL-2014]
MLNNLMNLNFIFDYLMMLIFLLPSNMLNIHPLYYSLLLILFTLILCLKMNYFIGIYWYSYILFLIMIGGVMILLMYFSGVSMNEEFMFLMNYMYYLMMKMIYLLFMLMLMFYMFSLFNFMYLNLDLVSLIYYFKLNFILFKNLYMSFDLDKNIYLIIYLLIMMICSVLICVNKKIPMRQFIK